MVSASDEEAVDNGGDSAYMFRRRSRVGTGSPRGGTGVEDGEFVSNETEYAGIVRGRVE